MKLQIYPITYKKLDIYILVVLIYSLLFFSADGILSYGSIPTYLILVGLFVKILQSPKYLLLAKYEEPFLLFLLCLSLSIIFSPNTVKLSHIQSFLLMFLTYVYGRSISIPKAGFQFLIWIFLSFILIDLSLMTAQLVTGNPIFFPGKIDYLMPAGISGDPHMNALSINISYAFIQSYFIKEKKLFRAFSLFILCLAFLIINASRAGLVAFFVTTAYIIFLKLSTRNVIMLIFICIGILLGLNFDWYDVYFDMYDFIPSDLNIAYESARSKYTAFFTDESVNERYLLWLKFEYLSILDLIKLFTFGTGPGSFDSLHGQTIHNSFFDILNSVGLIGLISLGVLIYRVVKRSVKRTYRIDCFALSAVVVCIVISSMFHDFGRTRFLWLFLGLTACCHHRHPYLSNFLSRDLNPRLTRLS